MITLQHNERLIAVVPEKAQGPGWSNTPLWVHIADYSNNSHRVECIQPEDQTPAMRVLFHTLRIAHDQMLALVKTRRLKE
jgi:hypothetical protein